MSTKYGRVIPKNGLNLRKRPGGLKLGTLLYNEDVEILNLITVDDTRLYQILTAEGLEGYVHGAYIEELGSVESFNEVIYTNSQFKSDKAIIIDGDFIPLMNHLNTHAKSLLLNIFVTSSLREINKPVDGAIVEPATHSCHHIGHAIDVNLIHNSHLYNSEALKPKNFFNLPEPIVAFITLIRNDSELRWGGDFVPSDPVHIDDDLYHRDVKLYGSKLRSRIKQL